MSIKSLIGAIALSLACGAASASSTLYDCDMNVKIVNGWVSPKIALIIASDGSATVLDSVALNVIGGPVPAKVRRSGGKLRFSWSISGAEDRSGERVPKFSYTARITEASKAIQVVAKPVGYPQRFSGKGTCTTRQAK